MRRQQIVQVLQYIFVWVIIYVFCAYVLEKSFINIVLKYWLLFLVATISYFYYYSIQYELDKKFEFIRNGLVYWNLYLFVHVFFRPLLNISHELFVLLWLIILWIRWTTKMKSRWKYLLQFVWWIVSFFIVLSWMFYFYPDKPDIEWFINNGSYKIVVEWVDNELEKSDTYINIKDSKRSTDYIISPNFTKDILWNCKISYPSIKIDRKENVIIKTPEWKKFFLFPQSEVQLEFEWKKMIKFSKVAWKVMVFSWMFEDDIDIVWEMEKFKDDKKILDLVDSLDEEYKYELVYYLKNQISESKISLANNTIMYNIDWVLLKFLAKIFPTSFSKNLKNYKEFMGYFALIEWNEVNLKRFSKKNESWISVFSLFSELIDDVSIWVNNIYWWRKN